MIQIHTRLGSLVNQLRRLWKDPKPLLVLVVVSGVFAGTGLAMLGRAWWAASDAQRTVLWASGGLSSTAAVGYHRSLDGALVATPEAQDPPLAAVVIDNISEARPQAGIADAPFVWEVPVEGGMTRFVAIKILPRPGESSSQGEGGGEGEIDGKSRIGPVRSVRPYLLDLASEFHAPLFHVGGSPEALKRVKNGVKTINEFSRGRFFYRDPARPRPSNVFISTDRMHAAILSDGLQFGSASSSVWRFSSVILSDRDGFESPPKAGAPLAQKDPPSAARTIQVPFGAVTVEWRYDPARRAYVRFQNGAPHTDEKGREIIAANVIVQEAPVEILDSVGRRHIDLFGEGHATVYRGGEKIEALWRRPFRNARTRFFDAQGTEIPFSPGTTWVEVVPTH